MRTNLSRIGCNHSRDTFSSHRELKMDSPTLQPVPTSEELKAELLAIPDPPEQPDPIDEPGFEELVAIAVRHVRGRRGGDLVSVILVGPAFAAPSPPTAILISFPWSKDRPTVTKSSVFPIAWLTSDIADIKSLRRTSPARHVSHLSSAKLGSFSITTISARS